MDENIKLNVTSENGIVEIRTGEALPLYNPKSFSVAGQLKCVAEYIAQNYARAKQGSRFENAVVLIDKKKNKIEFIDNVKAAYGQVNIIGILIENPDLKIFGINKGITFNKQEIQQRLRQNAILFKDFEQVKKLIKALDELQLTTEETIKDVQDKRGNVDQAFKRTVRDAKGLLPEYIELHTHLYEGFEKVSLKLEIEVDLDGRMPVYSFYCLELDLMLEQNKIKAFDECITEQMINDFTVLTIS